ncbi:MAG TPA: hypothetical protein VJ650_12825 [Gemmatimonadaceae bacterium]|nr:hypothetical protein [Gemmatimonadaceae bacterium]
MSSPRPGDMSAGFIGLAVSVLFLLATVTTIIALTNRAFAGHAQSAPAAHSAPATQTPPANQEGPGGEQRTPQPPAGQTPPASHPPGGH